MKTLFLFLFISVVTALSAQGTLQFNRALIQADQLTTVPAGKVWKVTAVYGKEFVCRSVFPLYNNWFSQALVAGFFVNGVEVQSSRKFLTTTMYSNSPNCTANSSGGYNFTSLNFDSDPNTLPVWLPAGTTVQSVGPNTFLSVLEFNILP
jgi:hypothetical protein